MGVTSGRVETGTLRNSKFYVTWQQKEQNIPENYNDINWQAGLNNGDTWLSNAVKINNVVIDGETVSQGGTWSNITTKGDVQLLSGTKRIYHNNDGKKSFSISISGWLYSYSNTSGSGIFELVDIPRQATLIQCNNFNSNENPYMEINNPGVFTCNLKLEFSGTSIIRNNIAGSGGYIFELTETERNLLYSKCPNSNSLTVRYVVETIIDGEYYWSYADRTMTVVNSNPIFSNFEYQDTNEITTALTGNNQIVIKGYSKVKGIISTANKATAQNSATMSKYILNVGDNQAEVIYSDTEQVETPSIVATSPTLIMYAQDSRNNSTSKNVLIPANLYKTYTEINIKEAKAIRTGGVGTEVTLDFNGYIWNENFGQVQNDIVSCKYRYKKSNEDTWTESDQELSPVKSGNSYSLTTSIKGDLGASGFTRDESFDIEIIITDKLSTDSYHATLGNGKPNIAIHKNGVAFGEPYDTDEGGSLQVDGKTIIERGSNSNGEYIKFYDRTMICMNEITPSNSNTTYHYQSGTWTYPATFIETPDVIATPKNWNTSMVSVKVRPYLANCGVMTHTFSLATKEALDTTSAVSIVAIGKWK